MALNAVVVSDAVFYDDSISTGHAHRADITIKDDGVCHIAAHVVTNSTLTLRGYNTFNGITTAAGGPYHYTSLNQLPAANNTGDLNRIYVGLQNEYGAGCNLNIGDAKTFTRIYGGSYLVYTHEAGGTHADPINIKPTNLSIPIAYQANNYTGVSLEVGEMIYMIWVNTGWRVLQTTGTYTIG